MIRNIIRFVVILGLCCLVMGGGVAVLYAVFKADLARRDNEAREFAIREVAPEGSTVDMNRPIAGRPFADDAVYAATIGDKMVAYIAGGEATGYSSTVRVVLSVRAIDYDGQYWAANPNQKPPAITFTVRAADRKIEKIVVVSQNETPGLGTRVAESRSNFTLWDKLFGAREAEQLFNPFLGQFAGKTPAEFKDVHAMTAATITSNATKRAAEQAIERIQKALEKMRP
jgi:Na+-translocating ferredoxin:NAD+ oxidoreductase RnfG subunit